MTLPEPYALTHPGGGPSGRAVATHPLPGRSPSPQPSFHALPWRENSAVVCKSPLDWSHSCIRSFFFLFGNGAYWGTRHLGASASRTSKWILTVFRFLFFPFFFFPVFSLAMKSASLEREILWSQPPESWVYKQMPPYQSQRISRDSSTGSWGEGWTTGAFVVQLYFGETKGQVALAKACWALVLPP